MLTIRASQFLALEQAPLEGWLSRHVQFHFPAFCAALPGGRVAGFVRQAVLGARKHGFRDSSHLAHWVNLSVVLGQGFDIDPAYPWVRRILAAQTSQAEKMLQLLEAAEEAAALAEDDADPEDEEEEPLS